MSVRHIYAKKGEYIVVHRNSEASGSPSNSGLLNILMLLLAVWLIIRFWKVILFLGLSIAACWIIYSFRRPIIAAIRSIAAKACPYIARMFHHAVRCLRAGGRVLVNLFAARRRSATGSKQLLLPNNQSAFANGSDKSLAAGYGEIIQRH